jgi:acetoin utilization deacetylase AcuC-like enzyme
LDIHLADGTGDTEYLEKLGEACRLTIAGFEPEILFYVAGADPYIDDQLGGLNLTMEGLKERDELVAESALSKAVPVVVVLAGGYARELSDTVSIHVNTAYMAEKVLRSVDGWAGKT